VKAKDYLYLFFLVSIYLIILVVFKPQVFTYKFDPSLVDRYLCSQDIPYEPPCKRIFLSDSDLYMASGYLYAKGNDPTSYDFQVPPLIKYLYGYSILAFNNPYVVQVGLGILFLCITYLLGLKSFKISEISLLACFFLVIDPLFLNLSSATLLDLGQGVFLLLYFMAVIFYKKHIITQGIFLGLLFATKFWGGSLFFVLLLLLYQLYKRQFDLKRYLMHLLVAFAVFSLVYVKTFVDRGGNFNIIFFELKVLKYYINHNTASIFGSSLFLFLTGSVKSWWGSREIIRSDTWSLFWVLGIIVSSVFAIKETLKRSIDVRFLMGSMPFLYLIYLGVQAPFSRYFILILPFIYLMLAGFIYNKFKGGNYGN